MPAGTAAFTESVAKSKLSLSEVLSVLNVISHAAVYSDLVIYLVLSCLCKDLFSYSYMHNHTFSFTALFFFPFTKQVILQL